MKALGERDLAAWFTQAMRQYDHVVNPALQGTITAISRQVNSSGVTTGYLCSVQRNGESGPDGALYPTLGGYVPVVGDVVELWWRDANTAYVIGSVIPQRLTATRINATSFGVQALTINTWANLGGGVSATVSVASRLKITGTVMGSMSVNTSFAVRVLVDGAVCDSGGSGVYLTPPSGGFLTLPIFDTVSVAAGPHTVQIQILMAATGNFTPQGSMLQFLIEASPS